MQIQLFIISLASLLNFHQFVHGDHTAEFIYSIGEDEVSLVFRVEESTLNHFKFGSKCENYQTASAYCLTQYINENSQLSIDGIQIDFELESAQKDKGHYILELKSKGNFRPYHQLKIRNKCFLEYDHDFANRVILQKEYEVKSYLLSSKSQEIKIEN